MHAPRLPDWLIYATVVLAILFASLGRRERADAPPAPPPVPGDAQMPIAPSSPFAPAPIMAVDTRIETVAATAFSISDSGAWLTARRVVEGCRKVVVVVAPGRGVAARIAATSGDLAVLATQGGAPALPLAANASPRWSSLAYHPGFPQRGPGEAATRLLGVQVLHRPGRDRAGEPLLAWALVGRTEGLGGPLSGLAGAPALDGDGRVIGVTLGEAPRRGRLYTTTPAAIRGILAVARIQPQAATAPQALSTDNYGRVADALRLSLSIAQVVCLPG